MAVAAGLANLLWAVWQAGEERRTLVKRAFRGVCPQIFQSQSRSVTARDVDDLGFATHGWRLARMAAEKGAA